MASLLLTVLRDFNKEYCRVRLFVFVSRPVFVPPAEPSYTPSPTPPSCFVSFFFWLSLPATPYSSTQSSSYLPLIRRTDPAHSCECAEPQKDTYAHINICLFTYTKAVPAASHTTRQTRQGSTRKKRDPKKSCSTHCRALPPPSHTQKNPSNSDSNEGAIPANNVESTRKTGRRKKKTHALKSFRKEEEARKRKANNNNSGLRLFVAAVTLRSPSAPRRLDLVLCLPRYLPLPFSLSLLSIGPAHPSFFTCVSHLFLRLPSIAVGV